jgi:5-methylcytosine-specific restriction endonuclease McrA
MERYERHREKRIALAVQHAHKRRLRLLAGEHDPTVTRANLRRQYGDHCFYCDQLMDFARYTHTTRPRNLATLEHVEPISKGGGHTWDNVVLACLDCNLRKNARTLDEWAA